MKTFIFVAVLAFVAVAVQGKVRTENGETSRPAPWYSCSGKEPGNYLHPRDCTRFISCDAGLEAWERDCGDCSNRPEACTPQNRLVYNVTVDACLWATDTECHEGGEGETTTEDPVTEEPRPPQAGDPCNLEECKNIGYCQTYLRCDKETEKLVLEDCGDSLFWNPNNGSVHGGSCDFLENLSEELEREYRKDPECLACFWEATGECEQVYRYQAPNQNNRNVLTLRCSNGLVFSQEKETCQRCGSIQKTDGTTCC